MTWPGRRIGAAALLLDDGGRVLLVRHTYGRLNWELPGGAGEPGESVAETARREVREETGLAVEMGAITGVYYEAETDAHHFVFRCEAARGVDGPRPSSPEISECAYWPRDGLPRPISDFTVRRIDDGLAANPPTEVVPVPPRSWLG